MTTNNLKTVLLLGLLGVVFIGVGSLLGGQNGAFIALGFAGVMNFAMYFWSDKMALRMSKAKPAEEHELPHVYRTVRYLAQSENIPMPKIYVIDSPQPNAFATGRNPKHAAMAVTTGILDLMNERELEGVLAHEISHIKNRDILIATIAATIAAALAFLARMAFWGSLFGGRRRSGNNPVMAIVGLVAMMLAPLAAALIQMAISRSREFQADRSGAETTGSPLNLASALAKLEEGTRRHAMQVNPAVSQLFIADPMHALRSNARDGKGGRGQSGLLRYFRTHPPTEKRIERLENMTMGIR